MDSIIQDFIEDTYHPDLCLLITEIFNILNQYNYPDLETDFVNLLMQTEVPQEDRSSLFIPLLHSKIDFVLKEHTLVVSEETSLEIKKKIIEGLYRVQELNDYTEILPILESDLSNEDKLGEVLAHLVSISVDTVFTAIIEMDESLLINLKQYITEKENSTFTERVSSETEKNIITKIKELKIFLQDRSALGVEFVENNLLLNQPFEHYLVLAKDRFEDTNDEQLALDLFSIILLSKDGLINPLLMYRKHSGDFIHDLTVISKIDALLITLINQFDQFTMAQRIERTHRETS